MIRRPRGGTCRWWSSRTPYGRVPNGRRSQTSVLRKSGIDTDVYSGTSAADTGGPPAFEDWLTVVAACATAGPATAGERRTDKLPPANEASPNTPVAQTGASRQTQSLYGGASADAGEKVCVMIRAVRARSHQG